MDNNEFFKSNMRYCISFEISNKKVFELAQQKGLDIEQKDISLSIDKNLNAFFTALQQEKSPINLNHIIYDNAMENSQPGTNCYMLFFHDIKDTIYFEKTHKFLNLITEKIIDLSVHKEVETSDFYLKLSHMILLQADLPNNKTEPSRNTKKI